ncbi:hypothetical protein F4809DRAFT_642332 [Biscogniauxia mediterranea]|nr:hypothetical protein F4809DRAFT_642332 [Biscogniauxia mediterranea]
MYNKPCSEHSAISILQWKRDALTSEKTSADSLVVTPGGGWQELSASSADLHTNSTVFRELCSAREPVSIIFASANRMRRCPRCLASFRDTLCMPDLWWTDYCENSNGYFGSEEKKNIDGITGINTWAYFEVKHIHLTLKYRWEKLNFFVRWIPSRKHTVIVVFDAHQLVSERLRKLFQDIDTNLLGDPFWPYMIVADELVHLQDSAVWAIRDLVRNIETEKRPEGKPEPDYRRLHDIARHAIHVVETLDVANITMDGIISQHESIKDDMPFDRDVWRAVHRRLSFFKQIVGSLRCRSESNAKRLENEIQLAFNTVSQYDSGVAVAIGQVAQVDSAAMRTVSSLTLVFLPPTFISAVFSMSFFNFDSGDGKWAVSDQFWIYWACAIPITFITSVLWYFWHKNITPVDHIGLERRRTLTWRQLRDEVTAMRSRSRVDKQETDAL